MLNDGILKSNGPLLEVEDLCTWFYTLEGVAKAVDGVSFHLEEEEILGVVGESGCGKTMTSLSILRLIESPPGKIVGGKIKYKGNDLLSLSMRNMRAIRGKDISMIFQEPMTSLNPCLTIGSQIAEVFLTHQSMKNIEALDKAKEMLYAVGIPSPEKRIREYPHQLSGGMRQRAMIAMALACRPKILIADEPTTALDVTTQKQILNLMLKLKVNYGTAILLITHNLGVIAQMAQRVIVMYAGRIVEVAGVMELFSEPLHPYTQGLLGAMPRLDQEMDRNCNPLKEIIGTVPNLLDLPKGCKYHPRCSQAFKPCSKKEPTFQMLKSGHGVRCWRC